MTTKRLKILIIVMSIILIFMLGFNLWHGEDIITEQDIQPTTGALSVWATTVDNVEETIIYTREMTEKRLAEKVNSLVGNESISYAIVHECATQTDDYMQCIKNIIWVSNAESGIFKQAMYPSNNWFWWMQNWKKKKFSSVEESIKEWVAMYVRNGREKRVTWKDWLRGNYCASECSHWVKNYNSAIKKLELD